MTHPLHPRNFLLKPFPGEENRPGLTIGGSIVRRADTLSVLYEVRGNLSMLAIPGPVETPRRKERLWEGTCLELFLGTPGSARYWEFNLSPAGHWNVYRFTRYREGMREESAYSSLPFRVRIGPGTLWLSVDIGIARILPSVEDVRAGIAAVIETVDGGKSHWAPAHPGPRPDFHRRDRFLSVSARRRIGDPDRP